MFERLYAWYGKRMVIFVGALIVLLIVIGVALTVFRHPAPAAEEAAEAARVSVKSVSELQNGTTFRAVGTVEAVSEAQLETEAGGRVTAVTTELGAHVAAGAVIASLENSAQRAALLQAEGAYDAAKAGAASSDVSVESAQNSLRSAQTSGVNAYQSAYISVESTIHNDIDDLFAMSDRTPIGFRFDAQGHAPAVLAERMAIEGLLTDWAQKKDAASAANVLDRLAEARGDVERISSFVETLSMYINEENTSDSFSATDKATLEATLTAARQTLAGVSQSLSSQITAIEGAQKGLEQAQIAGSSGVSSASAAQVKIALGGLRAAQAAYEKTIVRSPISGTVNALYLKEGEYVSPSSPAAIIANNNGLQISTAVNEEDSAALSLGDRVAIEGGAEGTIVAKSPALDPTTGKIALKISIDEQADLKNGAIVTLTFASSAEKTGTITVPLASLKMTSNGPVAFKVENGTLVALPVAIGTVLGDAVIVESGLASSDMIVEDARGLKEGQNVTVAN
jgi:RND family efflux transporter MFP subunit